MSSNVEELRNTKRRQAKHSIDSQPSLAMQNLLDSLTLDGGLGKESNTDSRFFKHASSEKMAYHIASDIFSFTVSVFLAYLASHLIRIAFFPWLPSIRPETIVHSYPIMFGLPMVLVILASRQKGHYSRFKGFWEELGEFLQIGITMAGLTIAYLFFIKSDFSRLWLTSTWAFVFALVPLSRWATKQYLIKKGRWTTPTIVVGSGPNALDSAVAIESNVLMGFEVI
ncbi:MAG: hypothetical protein KDJ38_16925, partial [Gammaproteobacteria bacterium]|nr:hypothetical protein [Gammaproteobacteria bacterium]